ncbi:MAG: DUF5666 domain-containing protein [Thermoanaerobaculia bacterium]
MRKLTTFVVAISILVVPQILLAHGTGSHVMGTVTAVDSAHIEVKTQDGQPVSVPINSSTKYFKGKAGAAATDVTVGARVVVHRGKDGVATEVRLGPAKEGR